MNLSQYTSSDLAIIRQALIEKAADKIAFNDEAKRLGLAKMMKDEIARREKEHDVIQRFLIHLCVVLPEIREREIIHEANQILNNS